MVVIRCQLRRAFVGLFQDLCFWKLLHFSSRQAVGDKPLGFALRLLPTRLRMLYENLPTISVANEYRAVAKRKEKSGAVNNNILYFNQKIRAEVACMQILEIRKIILKRNSYSNLPLPPPANRTPKYWNLTRYPAIPPNN